MLSSLTAIDTMNAYQNTCVDIVKLVSQAKLTNREDETIAAFANDLQLTILHAEKNAIRILQDGDIRPTYILMSKAGNGITIPIVLDKMPDNHQAQILITGPLSLAISLAPIDCYFFMTSMWAAPVHPDNFIRPGDRDDRIRIVLIRVFSSTESQTVCYTIVCHPENHKVMGLYPFQSPVTVYDTDNPCVMNFYELADKVLSEMTTIEIAKFRNDIFGLM